MVENNIKTSNTMMNNSNPLGSANQFNSMKNLQSNDQAIDKEMLNGQTASIGATGSLIGFSNISDTLSSLIMQRPSTHQNGMKPLKNIKTLTRIQSQESKNFMSQRKQNQMNPNQQTFGISKLNLQQTHQLLRLKSDKFQSTGGKLRSQSPELDEQQDNQKLTPLQDINRLTSGLQSAENYRLKALSRGGTGGNQFGSLVINFNSNNTHFRNNLHSTQSLSNLNLPDFPQSTISRGTTSGGGTTDLQNEVMRTGSQGGQQNSLRLDLQKLHEYKSLIDQKEKTISDLRNRLKFNESKVSVGTTGGGFLLKSNLMKADSLMNFRLNEHTDITDLKRVLITLISETKQTEEVLVQRCNKLREMLDLYEARVQFDDMLFLKEKDVQRMNEHIKHLTDSLVNASKNELLFNEKVREMAKLKHDQAMTKSRNDFLEKQNLILTQEIKDLKQQMINMKELEMQMNKQRVADQNQLQVMTRRLDTLEKGLEVFQDNRRAKPDDEYKLKNTVNFLIRETQELKKDIQLKKKTIENKDREIQKLLSKIQKFLSQKNEEGDLNDDEEFGQDQFQGGATGRGSSGINGELFTNVTGSLATQEDGILQSHLPAVNKFEETKKNLEYRYKSMSSQDKSTLTELIESGSQFFVDYLVNKGDITSVKDKFKLLCEQLLKSNRFIEKINYLVHLPFQLIRKNDEKLIINSIAQESQNFIDKSQRITLWVRDTLNNELWTYIGDRRLQVESHTDVIGLCCSSQNTVVIQNVKESYHYDKDFEQMFQEIDPYGYKERQFVLALPVKHPRTSILLGVLEICLLRQASLDDYFLSDGLAQLSGLLLSRFQEQRGHLKSNMNLKKIIERARILINSGMEGEASIGLQIENLVKDMFGVQMTRFIYIKNNQSIWYQSPIIPTKVSPQEQISTDQTQEFKSSINSLALEVAELKIGLIFGQPQQEKNFNGSIDISTNLPLVCYPIFDHSYLAEKRVLGVIEIPQPQLRYGNSKHSYSKIKDMVIDEVLKESLDTLSKLVSQIILNQNS